MDFVINLEYKPYVSLYRRLSDALRKAIGEGRLKPGEALPSVRDLATSLRISRSTVLKSFEDLQSQGYLEATRGAGTIVSRKLPGDLANVAFGGSPQPADRKRVVLYSAYGSRLLQNAPMEAAEEHHVAEINYGGPPLNLTPLQQWKQLLLSHCRMRDLSRLAYSVEPFGYPPLREAIAAYLARSRAVRCKAEQVVVFSGREFRFDIIARILLDPGDMVAVENPGFPSFRHRLASYGAQIAPVAVDKDGLCVENLASLSKKPKFVCVTPSHHDPTGVVLSLPRRKQLLDWAQATGCFIVEDDFDCEYRYGSSPLPALQGLDTSDSVIHMRCFWKILFPVLRLGFLVIPESLIPVMTLAKSKVERDLPLLEQFALTDFINEGFLERHIRRTQPMYAHRRQSLIYALTRYLGKAATIFASTTGTDMLVRLSARQSEEQLLELAAESGVPMVSTRPYYMEKPANSEFMVSYGHLDEEAIDACIKKFAELLSGSP